VHTSKMHSRRANPLCILQGCPIIQQGCSKPPTPNTLLVYNYDLRATHARASLLARLPLSSSAECATPTNTSLFANFPRNLANAPLPSGVPTEGTHTTCLDHRTAASQHMVVVFFNFPLRLFLIAHHTSRGWVRPPLAIMNFKWISQR